MLPAGEHTGDSVEWLSSERMKEVVGELREANDAVVFDSPGPTFRHEIYTEYKATRSQMPEELAGHLTTD